MPDFADLSFRVDSRPLRTAKGELRQFGEEGQRAGRRTDGIARGLGKMQAAARGLGGALATIGAGLTIGSVIQTLGGFEKSMAKVQAISGATNDQFQALRETAKDLGSTTEFTASQAADAMGFLSMAGFSAAETLEAIPTVLDLATASGMDLARTADIASNVLSGFQLEVAETARVADVLAKSASISNTNVEQMGNAMSYAAPVAAALGISIEEAASAVGVLSDAGIQGERAGTSLRTALSQLGAPSKNAMAALSRLGLTADDVNPALNSMSDIFASLRDAGVELADATDLVGIEAASSLLVLTSGAAKYDEYTGKLRGATGASQDMAATMRDNLNGAIQSFGSSIEGLIIALGDAGLTDVLRSVIDTGTEFVRMLSGMDNLAEVAMTAGVAAAALGALIFPFAAVGVAAAAAAVYITTHWEELRERFPRIFAAIDRAGEILSGVFGGLRDALGAAAGWVREKALLLADAMSPAVEDMKAQAGLLGDAIGAAWQGDWSAAWDAVKALTANGVEGLLANFDAVRNFEMPEIDLSSLIPEEIAGLPAVEKLTSALGAARDVLVDLADRAVTAVSTIFDGALAGFSERMEPISAAADRLRDALGPLGDALSGFGTALAGLFAGTEGSTETADRLTSIGSAIGKIAAVLTEGLLAQLTGMARGVTALVEAATAALEGDWETAWDLAASAPQALLDEMSGLWGSIKPVLEDLWRDVKAAVAGWPDDLKKVGGDIVNGLVQGIKDKIQDAKDAIAGLGSLLPSVLRREVDSNSPSRVFMAIGHDITDGLAIGITQRGKAAEAAAVGVADGVLKGAKRALDIRSPSRKFHGVGTMSIDGMIDGIEGRTGALVAQIEDTAGRAVNSASSIFEGGIEASVDYMIDGFKDGLGGLVRIFTDTLKQMAAAAIKNKIMIGLGFGPSGAGAMGSGLMSSMGGVLGGIGSTLAGLGTTFMQNAIGIFGADMAGLSATLAGATSSLSGFAAAAGALALPIAGAVAAFDFFRSKTKKLDEGVRLTTEGMATAVESWERIRKTRFWGLSTDTDNHYSGAPSDVANPLKQAVGEMQAGIVQAADALGIGRRAFADFSHQIKLSTKGMTEEEAVRALQEELGGLGEAFAAMVPGVNRLRAAGESAADALARTATSLTSVNAAFRTLGFDRLDESLRGGRTANRLVELSGGLDAFARATEFYFQNIMSAPDRLRALTRQFNQALDAANINARPGSAGQFQRQVERMMGNGARRKATALINLAPLFTEIQRLQGELDTTGDKAGSAADRLAAREQKAADIARERAGLEAQLLRLSGDQRAIRKAELADLFPANRALQRRIWGLEREAEAVGRATARQEERAGLQAQLWQMLGRENKLREQALADLMPANRVLQERIWRIQDEQAATERANAVADERRGLQDQLWQMNGREDLIRKRALRGLDESNRALQQRIWRIEAETAAMEKAQEVASRVAGERTSLIDRILVLEGNITEIRKRELAALTPATRGLQNWIYHLEDVAAAEARATDIAQERMGLQQKVWQLLGREDQVRRQALIGMDASVQEMQRWVWHLEDQAAATERANAVADEHLGIQRRIWELTGNTAAIQRDLLSALDPSNRALQQHAWALEKQAEAAEKASAVADERTSLENRILELQGNTAEIRRRELAGIDATNRSLQLMIYGLEDAARAMEDLDPQDFASRLDFERAQARAVNGVGGMTSTGVPLAVIPQTAPVTVQRSDPQMAEAVTLLKQILRNGVEIEGHTYRMERVQRDWDREGLPKERSA